MNPVNLQKITASFGLVELDHFIGWRPKRYRFWIGPERRFDKDKQLDQTLSERNLR